MVGKSEGNNPNSQKLKSAVKVRMFSPNFYRIITDYIFHRKTADYLKIRSGLWYKLPQSSVL